MRANLIGKFFQKKLQFYSTVMIRTRHHILTRVLFSTVALTV